MCTTLSIFSVRKLPQRSILQSKTFKSFVLDQTFDGMRCCLPSFDFRTLSAQACIVSTLSQSSFLGQLFVQFFWILKFLDYVFGSQIWPRGGGGNSTYYVMGTCHFARKIGTHNSVNSGGF